MKNQEVFKRHNFYYFFFKNPIRWYLRTFNRFKADKINIKKIGQTLVICNHVNQADPVYVGSMSTKPLYFIGTENIFELGFTSKFLLHCFNPIPKSKGMHDTISMKKTLRIAKEGGSIMVFPEGNCSYTGETSQIPFAISKLIKTLKLPVVFYDLSGCYSRSPRWSIYTKKGSCTGKIKLIWKYDEYKDLSVDEIYSFVKTNLYHDEYMSSSGFHFGKNMAEGLERLVFSCPKCNSFDVYTKEDNYICKSCNTKYTYKGDNYLTYYEERYKLTDLDKKVKENLINVVKNDINFKWYDSCTIMETVNKKSIERGEGLFTLTKDYFKIKGALEFKVPYDEINEIAIQGKKKLIIYTKTHNKLLLVLNEHVSPYKYEILYEIFRYYNKNQTLDGLTIDMLGLE